MSFTEKHKATGTMCNASQRDTLDWDRPHASTIVCDRDECRAKANRWIGAETNEAGVYRSFAEARALANDIKPQTEPVVIASPHDVPLFDLPGGAA